jgi:thiosulfate/3-mercaptopyruvate sulfurtransferase
MRWKHACPWTLLLTLFLATVAVPVVLAQESAGASSSSATAIPESRLIQSEALVQLLKAGEKEKPLILQVGSRVMFSQAHIPGSDYAGPGSQAPGIQSLENTVSSVPKDKQIVLYCGCCPWNRCPNVGPAYKRLHDLGFSNVKVLYIANNFGDDWVNKGYPAVKGK